MHGPEEFKSSINCASLDPFVEYIGNLDYDQGFGLKTPPNLGPQSRIWKTNKSAKCI